MKGAEVAALGYVDRERMASIYLNSDILVYPSYYEELAYAVLETMAYSLPVIASNTPSLNNMAIDGYNGFIIEPSDCGKLARLLSSLVENREMCHKIGKKNIEIVKEKFDPKLVAVVNSV
jgi:glycosyltransferase involved in cell wall biosynthesis